MTENIADECTVEKPHVRRVSFSRFISVCQVDNETGRISPNCTSTEPIEMEKSESDASVSMDVCLANVSRTDNSDVSMQVDMEGSPVIPVGEILSTVGPGSSVPFPVGGFVLEDVNNSIAEACMDVSNVSVLMEVPTSPLLEPEQQPSPFTIQYSVESEEANPPKSPTVITVLDTVCDSMLPSESLVMLDVSTDDPPMRSDENESNLPTDTPEKSNQKTSADEQKINHCNHATTPEPPNKSPDCSLHPPSATPVHSIDRNFDVDASGSIVRSASRTRNFTLPPLNRNPILKTTKLLTVGDCAPKTVGRDHRAGFSDGKHATSLATTPLRRIQAPQDWIQAVLTQRGDSFSRYDGARRYEMRHLMSDVTRLQSHAMRLESWPLPDFGDSPFGSTIKTLYDFLEDHSNVSLDADDLSALMPALSDLEQLLSRENSCSAKIISALTKYHRAFELSRKNRIQQGTVVCMARRSSIPMRPFDRLPVVERLSKMNELERSLFLAEAHERLYKCEELAKQRLRRLIHENALDCQAEKEWIVGRVQKQKEREEEEKARLCEELRKLKAETAEWREAEKLAKTTQKKLKDIAVKDAEVLKCVSEVRARNANLRSEIDRLSAELSVSNQKPSSTYRLQRAVGATELFVPSSVFADESRSVEDMRCEIMNLLSPSELVCLSVEENLYSIRTLFGLLCVEVKCQRMQESNHPPKPPPGVEAVPIEQHFVISAKVKSPPTNWIPVECDAVNSIATNAISFFNSQDGSSQLNARLAGLTLDKAVELVEFIMIPYLVLAADLRAIYQAEHEVEFEAPPVPEFPPLTPVHRMAPWLTKSSRIQSSVLDETENQAFSDQNPIIRLIPPGPFTVTVRLFHCSTRIALLLRFVFPSMDHLHPSSSTTSVVRVLAGRLNTEPIVALVDKCTNKPGTFYQTVRAVERYLTELPSS
ncbi:unnamed protein product [Calicophoron daubneyi]